MEYKYKANILRVIDGDTYEAEIILKEESSDLGFKIKKSEIITHTVGIRLKDIDTPEIRKYDGVTDAHVAHGKAASEFVRNLIEGKMVTLVTYKDKAGIYARYSADVILEDGRDLAQLLRDNGFEKKESYDSN